MRKNRAYILAIICSLAALALLYLNIYGMFFGSLRDPRLVEEKNVLFKNGRAIDLKTFREEIKRQRGESPVDFASRVNKVVCDGIVHVIWDKVPVDKYYFTVPPWENYILYALQVYPFSDRFRRYHFYVYKKTIERGIGVCGDAAMTLSGILQDGGIDTNIVAFCGHVIVEARVDKTADKWWILDPDYGVIIPHNLNYLISNIDECVSKYYADFPKSKRDALADIFKTRHQVFKNIFMFGPKTYLFEVATYWLIWIFPAFLLWASFTIIRRKHYDNN